MLSHVSQIVYASMCRDMLRGYSGHMPDIRIVHSSAVLSHLSQVTRPRSFEIVDILLTLSIIELQVTLAFKFLLRSQPLLATPVLCHLRVSLYNDDMCTQLPDTSALTVHIPTHNTVSVPTALTAVSADLWSVAQSSDLFSSCSYVHSGDYRFPTQFFVGLRSSLNKRNDFLAIH